MSFSRLKPLAVTMLTTALAACMSQPMADRVAAVSMETAPDNAMAHKSVARAERLGTQWGDEVQSSVRLDSRGLAAFGGTRFALFGKGLSRAQPEFYFAGGGQGGAFGAG